MKKCKKLREYAQFIAKIKEYLNAEYSIEDAIDTAIDECIRQHILEDILQNDWEEVHSMILTEYDEQAHIKSEKEISYEEGLTEGESRSFALIQLLLTAERFDDAKRASSDAEFRKRLYKEFNLM